MITCERFILCRFTLDRYRMTPLLAAALCGSELSCSALLEGGADVARTVTPTVSKAVGDKKEKNSSARSASIDGTATPTGVVLSGVAAGTHLKLHVQQSKFEIRTCNH
jgi:ankyrin repeat protein